MQNTLKKTAWPGEGMAAAEKYGRFKTAAMALRDDSVGIDKSDTSSRREAGNCSRNRGRRLSHRRCRLVIIYSENSHVPRCGFLNVAAVAQWHLGTCILTDGNNCVYRNRFQIELKQRCRIELKRGRKTNER